MKRLTLPSLALLAGASLGAQALEVMITPELGSVETIHNGQKVTIQRNQDPEHRVDEYFTYTSRKCPDFCIQPMQAAPGVETVGELEVLEHLARIGDGDQGVMVVDSRKSQWPKRGMIPGAVNVPWTEMDPDTADPKNVGGILMNVFGARHRDGAWDFGPAKTLVLYCNGPWCAQSNNMVIALLRYGYPADKIKWYRAGMQGWSNVGLTTVTAD